MMNQLIATPLFTISEGIISIDITSFKSVFQLYQHVLKEVPELIMLEQVVFQKNEKLVALALDYPFAVSSLSKARHNILDFLTDQIKLTKPTKEKCESNWLYFDFVTSLERPLIEVYRNKLSVSLPLSFPIHFKLAIKTLLENPHFSYGQSLTYSLRNKHNYHSLELLIDLLTEFPIERTNFVDYFFTILSMKDIKTEHERNFLLYASYVLLLWHYDLSPYQLIKLSPFSECPANTKDNFSKQVQKMQKEMVKAQEVLNQREFTGESTNGYVKVTVTGDRKVKQVTIDPQIIDPDDVEMVEDLVAMAVNDVIQKVEKEIESTMGKYTKGIPGF